MHRQTSMSAIQHMALGVYGFGCEDALNHLLNHVWPNIFESSPHVVQAFMGAVEGMRVGIGPSKILQYTLQVNIVILFQLTRFRLLDSRSFFWAHGLLCVRRACSTPRGKYETFTGRCTTRVTSARRTPWFQPTRGYRMTTKTNTFAVNSIMYCSLDISRPLAIFFVRLLFVGTCTCDMWCVNTKFEQDCEYRQLTHANYMLGAFGV